MTEQAQQPTFDLRRVYLKDASLEIPNAPVVFLENEAPKVNIEIGIETRALDSDAHEVDVTATLSATSNDKTFFLVEAKQSGVFEITGIEGEQLDSILNIVCPSMLFPYLRANVTDLLTRATLPPLYLNEINFEQIYQSKREQETATKQ